MLNSIEPLWSWLKYDRLSKFAPQDALQLNQLVFAELIEVQSDQQFLQDSFYASDLPIPRGLPF